MAFQDVLGLVFIQILAKGPFIDNTVVSCVVKNGRGNPRLMESTVVSQVISSPIEKRVKTRIYSPRAQASRRG